MQSPTVGPPSSSQTDKNPTSIVTNVDGNIGSASALDRQKGRTIDDIFDAIGKDTYFLHRPTQMPHILNFDVVFRDQSCLSKIRL